VSGVESRSAFKWTDEQSGGMRTDEKAAGIGDRIDRLEEIAETLEAGTVDLARAKELREEADDHLEWLRAELDVGDGDIVELDGHDVDLEPDDGEY
jgi:exonuclease VII small subunit